MVDPQSGYAGVDIEGGETPDPRSITHPSATYERLKPLQSGHKNRARTLLRLFQIVFDVLMLSTAFVASYLAWLDLPLFATPITPPPFAEYIPTMILQISFVLSMFYISRLYHQRRVVSRFDYARSIVSAVTIGVVLTYGMQDFLFQGSTLEVEYPRPMFLYTWVFSVFLAVFGREIHRVLQVSARRRGLARDNLLIVGAGRIARDITERIRDNVMLGYNIVGVVTAQIKPKGQIMGVPVVGLYQDLPQIIDDYHVEQVIIALPDAKRAELVELVTLCQRGQVDIKIYPDIFAYMAGDLNVDDLGGTPLLTVRDIALRGWKLSLKRGLDFIGAFIGLILLAPFMLLIALMIRLETKGPIFYAQIRMGLDGKPFPVIKFRSMRVDAEVEGPGWTIENDPRVTRIGRFLRRHELDELPQLVNVLFGEMSLVGPRPERPHYVYQFRQQIPRYMERHREKAGMTGWAQVNGLRGNTSIAARTSYDLWYVENWSMWLDIKIIMRTIWMVISRTNRNAY